MIKCQITCLYFHCWKKVKLSEVNLVLVCVILWTYQARICVLGFSAIMMWLVDIQDLVGWLIPDRRQPRIHGYCDDYPPVVVRWSAEEAGGAAGLISHASYHHYPQLNITSR